MPSPDPSLDPEERADRGESGWFDGADRFGQYGNVGQYGQVGEHGRFGGYGNPGEHRGRGGPAEWGTMSAVATLEDSENIGPHLAADLRAVGIANIEDLREAGSIEACRRLEERGLHDCLSALMALEGAIVGVRWFTLEPEHRQRLRDEWYRHGS